MVICVTLFMSLNTIPPLKRNERENKMVAVVGAGGIVRGTAFLNENKILGSESSQTEPGLLSGKGKVEKG